MGKWRKKPVVIDAFQWTGGPDQKEDPEWICDAMRAGKVRFNSISQMMEIDTLEGTHNATMGDFIIRGVKGEIYPCKPDIFAMTYEPAD